MIHTQSSLLSSVDSLTNIHSVNQLRENLQAHYPLINNFFSKVIIIGAAEEGQRLLGICDDLGIDVVCLCDDHPDKQGLIIGQQEVKNSTYLSQVDKNIPIIVASHRILSPIRRLRSGGHQCVVPFALLQILYGDKFPPHMFYDQWFESLLNGRNEIEKLIELLEDEKSLEVFNAIIAFRLTLDPEMLAPVIDWDLYASEDVLSFTSDEVYIDAGSFDGDSIKIFIDKVDGKFEKIYAFEPDNNTFKKLQGNFGGRSNIKLLNKGVYSRSDKLYFDNAGTRASIFTEDKESAFEIAVSSIDDELDGERVTYVKMNIEGAELQALQGAARSIAKYKPKLAISAYHRPTDLWEVLLLIKQLHPDYKFYLRQHDGGVIETVLYAI